MLFEPPRPRNDEERVLPLINVVFLLLIFFMLAGRLATSDPFEIAPPRSASEGPAETGDLLVLVGADGELALDGARVEEAALRAAVAERLAGDAEAQVRLKADGRAEATAVVAVMELLREAGVERLRLLTVPGGGDVGR
ncbi:biopolymer transporter ExbD [Salinarimonas sp.]|uniref:ExbD/TolR family protein n=1 Tax=Salinarimonas sp. TaxID=2766526 RepID=UPI0032D8DFC2